MDSLCLLDEIPIECTDDDAEVIGFAAMQSNEMLAVECQYGPPFAYGKCEHLVIVHGLFRSAGVLNGEHVMAQTPKRLDDRAREVLIRVEARHSGVLVFPDLVLDLLSA